MPPLKKKKGPHAKRKKNDGPTFSLFPQLPLEIQSQIWRFCLPTRRVVYLDVSYPRYFGYRYPLQDVEGDRSTVRRYRSLPSVARVCREAYRVAVEQSRQRQPYLIDDERDRGDPRLQKDADFDPPCVLHRRVMFNPATDVLLVHNPWSTFVSGGRLMLPPPPPPSGQEQCHHEVPRLDTLLRDPRVALCVTPFVALFRVWVGYVAGGREGPVNLIGMRFLHDVAKSGRRTFYLAMCGAFTITEGRNFPPEPGLFGVGGDESIVLVDPADEEQVAAYERAYNGTYRGKTASRPDMRYQIEWEVRGWANQIVQPRLDELAAEAVGKVEAAWAELMKQEQSLVTMPVPIPVLMFRRPAGSLAD